MIDVQKRDHIRLFSGIHVVLSVRRINRNNPQLVAEHGMDDNGIDRGTDGNAFVPLLWELISSAQNEMTH